MILGCNLDLSYNKKDLYYEGVQSTAYHERRGKKTK